MKYYDGQPDEQPTGKVTGGTGENIEIYSGTDKQITEQMFARINELQAQNSKLTKQVQLAREGMQEAIDRAYKYDIGKNAARILKQTLKQMEVITAYENPTKSKEIG